MIPTRRIVAGALLLVVIGSALSGCSERTTPLPPPLTDSAREILLSKALAPLPDSDETNEYQRLGVIFAHYVPDSEWDTIVEVCVEGGAQQSTLSSQQAANLTEGCELRFPPARLKDEIRSSAQWLYEYRYLRNFFLPCLRLHGAAGRSLPTLKMYLGAADAFSVPSPASLISRRITKLPLRVVLQECSPTAPGLG